MTSLPEKPGPAAPVRRSRDEIGEPPGRAAGMLSAGRLELDSIGARIKAAPRGIVIAARGSSDHAALDATRAWLVADLAHRPVAVLGHLLARRVGLERGIDSDRPPALNTW